MNNPISQRITLNNNFRNVGKERITIAMVVKGNVVGAVDIRDLGRRIFWKKEAEFSEYEVNRSRDLQRAIRTNWVEVVDDRKHMHGKILKDTSKDDKMDEAKMMEMATKMAKVMAKEMASETAKTVIEEMKKNQNTITQVIHTTSSENTKKDTKFKIKPEDTFIEIDQGTKVDTNINRIGKIDKKKTSISDSLNKMKMITKKVNKDDK